MKTVFDEQLKEIRTLISQQVDVLTKGAAKDYPEYREHVGVIRGLRAMENHINNLKQIQERADNE